MAPMVTALRAAAHFSQERRRAKDDAKVCKSLRPILAQLIEHGEEPE